MINLNKKLQVTTFVGTIFLSAFLLFLVQPMIGKIILPKFGGVASVWTISVLFFQVLLLVGYLYAHFLTTFFSPRRQFMIHMFLLAVSLLLLPVGVSSAESFGEYPQTISLLFILLAAIGGPFFFLSASSPLIQKWFWYSGAKTSENPYYLYAASNLGSMIALLSYPFLIEPFISLNYQLEGWGLLYVVLALAFLLTGMQIMRTVNIQKKIEEDHSKVHVTDVLKWIIVAFFPSSLMLGVTQYITTNIVAVPLMWILPLALYLLTFIMAFARNSKYEEKKFLPVFFMMFFAFAYIYMKNFPSSPLYILIFHLMAFFTTALLCHCRLALTKPSPKHLTLFYLCLAFGGALGGVFNGLVAPVIFNTTLEYPLVMFLVAIYFFPKLKVEKASKVKENMANLLMFAVLLAAASIFLNADRNKSDVREVLLNNRNFYGTFSVKEVAVKDTTVKALVHGTIVHGVQAQPPHENALTTYYWPLQIIFDFYDDDNEKWDIAAIGMGTATASCVAKPGQNWWYFELDPDIAALSTSDEPMFTFFKDCTPDAEIYLGDGRIELGKLDKDTKYDVIILDAFSSDSIPAHMITKEAFKQYFSRLNEHGIILVHISNVYMDLKPVLANLADHFGYYIKVKTFDPQITPEEFTPEDLHQQADWAVITRSREMVEDLEGWTVPETDKSIGIWTDDYYNIFRVLKAVRPGG